MPQPLTREDLEREHAALFASVRSEFMAAGAAAERDRIQAVRAALIPGHEALIERLAFDGKTTAGEAALAVVAAERETVNAAKAAFASDAPKAAPSGHKGAAEDPPAAKAKTTAQVVIDAAKAYAGLNKTTA